jgi:ABC-2 type transport system ATP-binding protein
MAAIPNAVASTQPAGEAAIETRALTKRFGARTAIDGVDLLVPRGTAFGFLGPNGAGKTTMIRMLLGLTQASGGTMSVLGRPVPSERAQALQRVGAIVEEPRFHTHLSGRENLQIIAAVRGSHARERIAPALARVGLAERAEEKIKRYSLGMRQRLGVARCLLADPQLLILDEPTNGLDPGGIQEFREMIRAMVEQEGRTVFISSHLLDEVEKICDAAAIVDRGKVVAQGPLSELTGARGRSELILGVDDADLAVIVLERCERAREVRRDGDGLRVVLDGPLEAAAEITAALVHGGVGVARVEPVRASLERRFLEITSRLQAQEQEVPA